MVVKSIRKNTQVLILYAFKKSNILQRAWVPGEKHCKWIQRPVSSYLADFNTQRYVGV